MSNTLSYERKETIITSKNNVNVELEVGDVGLRRVRQIERLLGVRIMNAPSKVLERKTSTEINHYEQAIQLLNAFELITDAKVRSDELAMVIAAAQHEHESD